MSFNHHYFFDASNREREILGGLVACRFCKDREGSYTFITKCSGRKDNGMGGFVTLQHKCHDVITKNFLNTPQSLGYFMFAKNDIAGLCSEWNAIMGERNDK